MSGTLESVTYEMGGRLIRFERYLKHPAEAVWKALTDPDKLSQWLARPDAPLNAEGGTGERELYFANSGTTVYSTVTDVQPPYALEQTWDAQKTGRPPEGARAAGDGGHCVQALSGSRIRWELAPEGEGTRLVLIHILDDTVDRPDYVLAAWHNHLDSLDEALGRKFEGGPSPEWPWTDWRALANKYAAKLS